MIRLPRGSGKRPGRPNGFVTLSASRSYRSSPPDNRDGSRDAFGALGCVAGDRHASPADARWFKGTVQNAIASKGLTELHMFGQLLYRIPLRSIATHQVHRPGVVRKEYRALFLIEKELQDWLYLLKGRHAIGHALLQISTGPGLGLDVCRKHSLPSLSQSESD